MDTAQALRNDRELVRARLETAEAATAVKLRILSLLKGQGREIPQWDGWRRPFRRWLKDEAKRLPEVVSPVLASLLMRLETWQHEVLELDRHLRHLAQQPAEVLVGQMLVEFGRRHKLALVKSHANTRLFSEVLRK